MCRTQKECGLVFVLKKSKILCGSYKKGTPNGLPCSMMRLVSNMYICAPETPLSEKEKKGLFLLYLPRSYWILQMQARFSFSQEDMCVVLNEAEKLIENEISGEPEMEQVIVHRKRTKGKRDLNLKDIEVEIIQHECTPEEL